MCQCSTFTGILTNLELEIEIWREGKVEGRTRSRSRGGSWSDRRGGAGLGAIRDRERLVAEGGTEADVRAADQGQLAGPAIAATVEE